LQSAELSARCPGYIGAKRFLSQIVPSGLKCTSPAATANPPVFTDSAFTFVLFKVAEMFQYLGVAPDLFQRQLPNIAAVYLQIATRLHLSHV
jgi:hypothetical protein